MNIVWTDYMRYRARLRGFDLDKIEHIVKYSIERYIDTATERLIVVGRHDHVLVMVPYEINQDSVIPISVHVTTRQQIRFRIRTGRFRHA